MVFGTPFFNVYNFIINQIITAHLVLKIANNECYTVNVQQGSFKDHKEIISLIISPLCTCIYHIKCRIFMYMYVPHNNIQQVFGCFFTRQVFFMPFKKTEFL